MKNLRNLIASDSDSFNEKLAIAFWTIIGLNLICLTIAIVRL